MCMEKTPWEKAYEFHGHICPGLAVGFRAAQLALEKLAAGRSGDEEIVAIVENSACGVDAVQVLSGCTFGKGNLIFRDYGKHVYTFINRTNGGSVRVAVKPGAFNNPVYSDLRKKNAEGKATPEEKQRLLELQNQHINNILNAGGDSFELKFVEVKMPPMAQIRKSIICDSCGEAVMDTRTVIIEEKVLCIPCAEEKSGR